LNNNTFSQCENFTLAYDRTVISRAPSVRFYSPRGPSRLLNLTMDEAATGTATYLMSFERNKEVVLVFDDGFNHWQSSALMTVLGDSLSNTGCLGQPKQDEKNEVRNMNRSTSVGISRPVVIGTSIGGAVVVLISILMLFFVLRERWRRQCENIEFNPSLLEKGRTPNPPDSRPSPPPISPVVHEKDLSPGFVKDPPYTAEKFLSPTTPHYPRESMASWAQPTPEDQRFPRRIGGDAYSAQDDRLSPNSLDIEGILNLATIQSNRSSKQGTEPVPLGPTLRSPRLQVPKRYPTRGHLRDPSDVPIGPTSIASAISLSSVIDPFADDVDKQPRSVRTPYRQASIDSPIRPPPGAVVGLLSSPRHGQRPMRQWSSEINEMG